jgi:hypothetical protein
MPSTPEWNNQKVIINTRIGLYTEKSPQVLVFLAFVAGHTEIHAKWHN